MTLKNHKGAKIEVGLFITFFLLFLLWDLYVVFIQDKTLKFKQLYGDKVNFFERLGQLDRKRWLTFEVYMRNELKFSLLDNEAFSKIKHTKVSELNLSVDPPNYNILFNWSYQRKIGYVPPHLHTTVK